MSANRSVVDAVVEVRKGLPDGASTLGAALGRAFFDEPLMLWAMPEDERRQRLLPDFFELFVRTILPYRETYAAGDALGAALWVPPGQPVVDDDAETFDRQLDQIVGIDAPRFADIFALLDEHHPAGSFFYLQFVGVVPEQQGRGIGSVLLTPVLQRCDREGLPAYLEATSPRSKKLYERHGFEATAELAPPGGPPLWPMWRQPAAS